jgi:hypothetical protein
MVLNVWRIPRVVLVTFVIVKTQDMRGAIVNWRKTCVLEVPMVVEIVALV